MFSSNTSQVSQDADYIEDVFSTWLYTGNGSTQTITNGIDLAGEGGLVWIKGRAFAYDHKLTDTVRGVTKAIISNSSDAQTTDINGLTSFVSNGFSLGLNPTYNTDLDTYVSWTFRKQPKFFDVVAYTGDGTTNRLISHNLQSTPGMLLVKRTDLNTNWAVWHRRSGGAGAHGSFNTTLGMSASLSNSNVSGVPVEYVVGANNSAQFLATAGMNTNGATYVAYLFAHDAGGFGLTGADNVITCGTYTGTGTTPGPEVTLGYEPQFLMIRSYNSGGNWNMFDSMRGLPASGSSARYLQGNTANAEASATWVSLTATGFKIDSTSAEVNTATYPYLYVAIRRGPMKVPTSGTSVFGLNARSGTGANATVTGGQTDDAVLIKNRGAAVADLFSSRLTGTGYLVTSSTAAEVAAGTTILQASPWDVMDGVKVGTTSTITNASSNTFINYLFRRAPGFFDEVCYTGTGSARTVAHNLGVAPELIIVKSRSSGLLDWLVYSAPTGNANALLLNTTDASFGSTSWGSTTPTASVFSTGATGGTNNSGATFVAYLFASCPGVSKVGSYTGTGTTQTINCGFTGGARFVLIKRTDSTGDWYVWDSARGIVAGNDPYLLLNSTAAEVTSTDYVDTAATGFELSSTAPAAINASGGSYIFLAIA